MLAGTALVIILVMLGGSLAAFAGVSVSAAREELTALLNAAQAFYTQYDVDAVDGATAGTSDANDPTGAIGATDPTGATDTANATNTTDATDAASATNTTDATDSAGAADRCV